MPHDPKSKSNESNIGFCELVYLKNQKKILENSNFDILILTLLKTFPELAPYITVFTLYFSVNQSTDSSISTQTSTSTDVKTFLVPPAERSKQIFRVVDVYKILSQSHVISRKTENLENREIFDQYPSSLKLPKIKISVPKWNQRDIRPRAKLKQNNDSIDKNRKYSMFYGKLHRSQKFDLLNTPHYSIN